MKTQRKPGRCAAFAVLVLALVGCASGETSSSRIPAELSMGISVPTTTAPPTSATVETYHTATPTITRPPTQAQTPSVPTTTVPVTAPEAARHDFFGLFTLPLGDRWVISEKLSNEHRTVVFDSNRCGSKDYADKCPLFVVVSFAKTKDWLPYENPEGGIERTPQGTENCHWNMIQDGLYYKAPEKVTGFVWVGKWETRFTSQQQCDGNRQMFSVRSEAKKFMVYEQDMLDDMMALLNAAQHP